MSKNKGDSHVSNLGKLSPPKLLEVIDNIENIWDRMYKRFPQTSALLHDIEKVIHRAESLQSSFQYRDIETQISLTDSTSEFVDMDNVENDFESLNEWSQVVEASFQDNSNSNRSVHHTQRLQDRIEDTLEKEVRIDIDKLSNLQNFHISKEIYEETISVINSMKSIEKDVFNMQPVITMKDTVLAPVQARISSYEDNLRVDNNYSNRRKRNSVNTLSLREEHEKKPSLIPIRSPREITSPRRMKTPEKSPKGQNIMLKLSPKSTPLFNNFASKNSCNRMFQGRQKNS